MSPEDGVHAAHVFFMLLPDQELRDLMLGYLRSNGVIGTFHYVPLHSSPAGLKYGRIVGDMNNTDAFSSRMLRIPLWPGMSDEQVKRVIDTIKSFQ